MYWCDFNECTWRYSYNLRRYWVTYYDVKLNFRIWKSMGHGWGTFVFKLSVPHNMLKKSPRNTFHFICNMVFNRYFFLISRGKERHCTWILSFSHVGLPKLLSLINSRLLPVLHPGPCGGGSTMTKRQIVSWVTPTRAYDTGPCLKHVLIKYQVEYIYTIQKLLILWRGFRWKNWFLILIPTWWTALFWNGLEQNARRLPMKYQGLMVAWLFTNLRSIGSVSWVSIYQFVRTISPYSSLSLNTTKNR